VDGTDRPPASSRSFLASSNRHRRCESLVSSTNVWKCRASPFFVLTTLVEIHQSRRAGATASNVPNHLYHTALHLLRSTHKLFRSIRRGCAQHIHHQPLLPRSDAIDGGGSSACIVCIIDRRSPKGLTHLYHTRNTRTSISNIRPNQASCIIRSTTTSSTPRSALMAIHPVGSPTKLLRNQRKPLQFAIKMRSRMVWWIRE
jgi:hypothetical protein